MSDTVKITLDKVLWSIVGSILTLVFVAGGVFQRLNSISDTMGQIKMDHDTLIKVNTDIETIKEKITRLEKKAGLSMLCDGETTDNLAKY